MPVYEYYCENCKSEYETMRPVLRMDEPSHCPDCEQPGRRLLSYFSFKSNTFSAPKLKPPAESPFRFHNGEQATVQDEHSQSE
jgi:putative FmdB family regulatory protein